MKRLFVPGVFDVFHVGHLNYIRKASETGDHIIVGIQDDRSVLKSKGIKPVIPLAERIAIIEALRFVDEVVSYTDVFQGPLLEGMEINVFAVGTEYGEDERYPGQTGTLDYCKENGIEVVRIPRTARVSSTKIRERLKGFWNSRAELNRELPGGVTVLGSFQGDQGKVSEETRHEVDLILNASGDASEKSLLDLGCGDGRQLVPLCAAFKRVVGVDFAPALLAIAESSLKDAGLSAELTEGDVSQFVTDEKFDVLLLSGILPCLDDLQVSQMLQHLSQMAYPDAKLLVRSSIGLVQRVDVVNQFSPELGTQYTGFYRTNEEVESDFAQIGWEMIRQEQLYQHREDTAVWWFEFRKASESDSPGESQRNASRVAETFND